MGVLGSPARHVTFAVCILDFTCFLEITFFSVLDFVTLCESMPKWSHCPQSHGEVAFFLEWDCSSSEATTSIFKCPSCACLCLLVCINVVCRMCVCVCVCHGWRVRAWKCQGASSAGVRYQRVISTEDTRGQLHWGLCVNTIVLCQHRL